MLGKIKKFLLPQLFIIYLRFLVGGTFVFASLIKIKGNRFTSESGADYPIASPWHLFETLYQSGLFWNFIGVGQCIAGMLLMTQRYAKLGAIASLPITANIFVITMSYYFAYTPVVTGLLLAANLLFVAWDWQELRVLLNKQPIYDSSQRLEDYTTWQMTGGILFLFTFIYRLLYDKYDFLFWLGACFSIGLIGLVIGLYTHYNGKNSDTWL